MPTVLIVGKYRFFFFSNEGNEPVHVHVESDRSHAKFWLKPLSVASHIGYSKKEMNRLTAIVVENKSLFEERWHEHFGGKQG